MTAAGYIRVTAISLLLIILGGALHNCGGSDDNIDSCSRRGKPQKWDGQKWSCK